MLMAGVAALITMIVHRMATKKGGSGNCCASRLLPFKALLRRHCPKQGDPMEEKRLEAEGGTPEAGMGGCKRAQGGDEGACPAAACLDKAFFVLYVMVAAGSHLCHKYYTH